MEQKVSESSWESLKTLWNRVSVDQEGIEPAVPAGELIPYEPVESSLESWWDAEVKAISLSPSVYEAWASQELIRAYILQCFGVSEEAYFQDTVQPDVIVER